MSGYLILAAGVALGVLATLATAGVGDYLIRRPVDRRTTARFRPATAPRPTGSAASRRLGAAAILGHRDLGGRWIPPTHPRTAGAPSSAEALAAWDAHQDKEEETP